MNGHSRFQPVTTGGTDDHTQGSARYSDEGLQNPEDLIGETGLLKQLTRQLLERAMQVEMTDQLGYEKNAPSNNKAGNTRNGGYQKKVKGEFGNLDITVAQR